LAERTFEIPVIDATQSLLALDANLISVLAISLIPASTLAISYFLDNHCARDLSHTVS
jgi:hypothetical protein